MVLDLAAGPEADKARAVASVARLWREPEWGCVVSTLDFEHYVEVQVWSDDALDVMTR